MRVSINSNYVVAVISAITAGLTISMLRKILIVFAFIGKHGSSCFQNLTKSCTWSFVPKHMNCNYN